jgi:hypothetical protein
VNHDQQACREAREALSQARHNRRQVEDRTPEILDAVRELSQVRNVTVIADLIRAAVRQHPNTNGGRV